MLDSCRPCDHRTKIDVDLDRVRGYFMLQRVPRDIKHSRVQNLLHWWRIHTMNLRHFQLRAEEVTAVFIQRSKVHLPST